MTITRARRISVLATLTATAFGGIALAGATTSHAAASHAKAGKKASTTLSIGLNRGDINPGGGATITGHLHSPTGDVSDRKIKLKEKPKGTTGWTTEKKRRTDDNGAVAFSVAPATTTHYKLDFHKTKSMQHSKSGTVTVKVEDTTSLTIAVAATSIEPGDSDTVNGVLSLDGTAISGGTVDLRAAAHHNKLAQVAKAKTDSNGDVTFPVSPSSTARFELTYHKTQTYAGARSATATIHVRKPSSLSIRARSSAKNTETINGALRGGGKQLAHKKVHLQTRPAGTKGWTSVDNAKTGHNGVVAFVEPAPKSKEDYRLRFDGDSSYDKCHSGVTTVKP
jgi:hypothetical protein